MTLTAQASSRHARSLLREPKFAWLWLAMTVSSFGAQITLLALPLAAVLLLNATPLQMGIMVAFETVPFSLFALHAGVYIDRVQKLPLLVIAHVIAGLTLLVVPLMAMLGL